MTFSVQFKKNVNTVIGYVGHKITTLKKKSNVKSSQNPDKNKTPGSRQNLNFEDLWGKLNKYCDE